MMTFYVAFIVFMTFYVAFIVFLTCVVAFIVFLTCVVAFIVLTWKQWISIKEASIEFRVIILQITSSEVKIATFRIRRKCQRCRAFHERHQITKSLIRKQVYFINKL